MNNVHKYGPEESNTQRIPSCDIDRFKTTREEPRNHLGKSNPNRSLTTLSVISRYARTVRYRLVRVRKSGSDTVALRSGREGADEGWGTIQSLRNSSLVNNGHLDGCRIDQVLDTEVCKVKWQVQC